MFNEQNKPCCIIEILHIFIVCLIFILLRLHFYFFIRMLQVCFIIGTWRNGSASDFGSESLGSNPGAPTMGCKQFMTLVTVLAVCRYTYRRGYRRRIK